jgi:hypothetical protein
MGDEEDQARWFSGTALEEDRALHRPPPTAEGTRGVDEALLAR